MSIELLGIQTPHGHNQIALHRRMVDGTHFFAVQVKFSILNDSIVQGRGRPRSRFGKVVLHPLLSEHTLIDSLQLDLVKICNILTSRFREALGLLLLLFLRLLGGLGSGIVFIVLGPSVVVEQVVHGLVRLLGFFLFEVSDLSLEEVGPQGEVFGGYGNGVRSGGDGIENFEGSGIGSKAVDEVGGISLGVEGDLIVDFAFRRAAGLPRLGVGDGFDLITFLDESKSQYDESNYDAEPSEEGHGRAACLGGQFFFHSHGCELFLIVDVEVVVVQ
mmetsp:Transcript_45238/g.94889  ORF Transcript_45238/g.94889 Transcript_45238/m.94889 type:complete len:274 (+) Transcript_45238:1087-1908(+)